MKFIDKMKENCSAEVMILAFVCFLAGLTAGFIASPAKNGVTIGSYNGWFNGWGNSADKLLKSKNDKNDSDIYLDKN
ncbi:MAG: hypothetical protein NC340_09395 [Ruminococcus flavefaciens]|nr:hypothetical protein [Ruminococcus flavefaciens]MCM1230632.1 hypothetical protein [Ruminococcus flavefaciens]